MSFFFWVQNLNFTLWQWSSFLGVSFSGRGGGGGGGCYPFQGELFKFPQKHGGEGICAPQQLAANPTSADAQMLTHLSLIPAVLSSRRAALNSFL